MAQSTIDYPERDVAEVAEEAPIRVLHVDNEVGFLRVAKRCLEVQGAFQVETAFSVEEAMGRMKKKTYDVIVCDYMMPGRDGLSFLKELRDNGNEIPFIVFTGRGREEVAIRALNLGADQYLSKVGHPEAVYGELAHSIHRALERKKMEETLRKSEEKYRTQFEEAMDAIFLADAETGIIVDCNRAASELVGKEKSELIGKHQRILHPPRDIERGFSRTFKQHLREKEGQVLETHVITKKGEIKDVAIKGNVFELRGKKLIQGIFRDITKSKESEKALMESEERFKTLMEEAPICICNTNLRGKITYVNKRFEEVTGYSRKEIVGKSGWKFVSDETSKLLRRRMKDRLMGKPSRLQHGQFKHKDGKWIWAEMEGKIIKKFGIPVGFQHIARDITERKRAQEELAVTLEKLEAMNEKLGVVGKLTRHDARNKLSTVTMNAFLAKQKLAGDHKVLKHLSEIESACRQVERIFDFARIYEMLGAEELAFMDVEEAVEDAAMLFSDLHGVKVVNDCRGLTVLADSLLTQILYNLIDNSLKHGEKVSQIRVHYEEMEKDQLKLVYEDDGVGIPEAEKEKIFKEGYGKDSGYGLYLIRKMCEVYGWAVRETGKHGEGAQFTIAIPKIGSAGKAAYRLR